MPQMAQINANIGATVVSWPFYHHGQGNMVVRMNAYRGLFTSVVYHRTVICVICGRTAFTSHCGPEHP